MMKRSIKLGLALIIFASGGWISSGVLSGFHATIVSAMLRPCENDTCGWHDMDDLIPGSEGQYYGCGHEEDSRRNCDQRSGNSECKDRKCRWWWPF